MPTATTATTTSSVTTYKPTAVTGFTSVGQRTNPSYVTSYVNLANENGPQTRPPQDPVKLSMELRQILVRSSTLDVKSKNGIYLEVLPGSTVRLSGMVANARDQRLAEGLVRMTPGVLNVENKLQIMPQPPQPQ